MLVSRNWLAELVPLPDGLDELTDRLTMSGLNLEGVEPFTAGERDDAVIDLEVTSNPRRLPRPRRRRPRDRRPLRGAAEAPRCFAVADRRRAPGRLPRRDRRPQPLPALHRPRDPRGAGRAEPAVGGGPAGSPRAAERQQRRRRHEPGRCWRPASRSTPSTWRSCPGGIVVRESTAGERFTRPRRQDLRPARRHGSYCGPRKARGDRGGDGVGGLRDRLGHRRRAAGSRRLRPPRRPRRRAGAEPADRRRPPVRARRPTPRRSPPTPPGARN